MLGKQRFKTYPISTIAIAGCVAIVGDNAANAGGQFVGDNGPEATARAGAFVAKADDPTALVHNPAGLALASEMQLTVSANLVQMSQTYQRAGVYENAGESYTGNPYPTVKNGGGAQPIPFIGVVLPRGKWALGAGLFAPQGYGVRKFPHQVTLADGSVAPAPQRYDAVGQNSRVAFPSVAAAYRVSNKLSVGARVGWGFAQIASEKYVQGLSSPGEEPGKDSYSSLEASDNFVPAFGLGLHYKPRADIEIGLAWNAPIAIHAVGTSQTALGEDLMELGTKVVPVEAGSERCAPGGQEGALAACVQFNLPMTASAGIRMIARNGAGEELGDLEVDVRWENWSKASDIVAVVDGVNTALNSRLNDTVVRHGLNDVFSIRIGGSGRLTKGKRPMVARAGLGYETAAAPSTWTRLDIDSAPRFSAAGGIGFFAGRYRIDLGVAAFTSPIREVRDVELADTRNADDRVQPDISLPAADSASQPYHPHNAGDYKTSYLIGSIGVTTEF